MGRIMWIRKVLRSSKVWKIHMKWFSKALFSQKAVWCDGESMDQTDLAADPASTTYQVLSSLYLDFFIVKWE